MIDANVPVVEVTVQEDRALVRREGMVDIPPGRCRLRIEGVAPVLVDKSLTAALRSEEGSAPRARVQAVTARRWRVTEPSQRPEALAALETQRHELQAQLQELALRRNELDSERQWLTTLVQQTVQELSQDSGWGQLDAPAAHTTLDDLEQRLCALGPRRCALEAEGERLQRTLADLQTLEAASQTVEAQAAAALEVEVYNPDPEAQTLQLRVDYLVPGALWRPWHRARLIEDGETPQVQLRCEGCVWQATGEDWNDVQVWFSTERPSLGLEPPALHTDHLDLRKKGPAVQVQTRSQQINTAGLGLGEDAPAQADELPGIDDGGEAQRLQGRGRTTIPGDGRPYRVPLFELKSDAAVELRCMPELAPAVLLRSEQTNTAKHPLLAGPVDLVRRSGLVGRTSVLYVAPGERFELGWGPDNGLRVTREVEHLEYERKTLSSWTIKPRRVRIKLSNLDASPRTVHVHERVAVSEIDKVKVELRVAEPRAAPDADGFVRWEIPLQGLGRHELRLEWALVVHDDVQGV